MKRLLVLGLLVLGLSSCQMDMEDTELCANGDQDACSRLADSLSPSPPPVKEVEISTLSSFEYDSGLTLRITGGGETTPFFIRSAIITTGYYHNRISKFVKIFFREDGTGTIQSGLKRVSKGYFAWKSHDWRYTDTEMIWDIEDGVLFINDIETDSTFTE